MTRAALLALVVAWPLSAHAGAWVPDEGHGYAEASVGFLPGAAENGKGGLELFLQGQVRGYLEMGLVSGRLAGLFDLPIHVWNVLPDSGLETDGFGDVAAGLRLGVVTGAWPVALEAWGVFPTAIGSGRLPTGYATFGGQVRLYVGHGFGRWWGQAGGGADYFDAAGWAARFEVQGGYAISRRLSVDGTIVFRVGFGRAASPPDRVLFRADEKWGALDLRLRYLLGDGVDVFCGADVGLLSIHAPKGVPLWIGISKKL